ncbi:MAG: FAD:protein transferase [Gaiellales bacterium]|nr:FAD:protein transferase [Gaiellales bacterium]
MITHRFEAMGTSCELLVDAEESPATRLALLAAEGEVIRLELLLSRFRPDSELSRLNREGRGQVGPELLELVELALDARDRTGGRFDPTVLPALTAAGYDRSFEEVASDGRAEADDAVGSGGGVRIDAATSTIELAAGVQLDLGGIAKGWTADRLCRRLDVHGPALANLGGDIAASRPPASGSWPVGVDGSSGEFTVALERGGLATSGRDRRRWRRDGQERHHAIDPATGRSSLTDLVRVTAAGSSGIDAEVSATALLLAGEASARDEADRLGVACVLVTADHRTVLAGGLA